MKQRSGRIIKKSRNKRARAEKFRFSGERMIYTAVFPDSMSLEPLLDTSQQLMGRMRETGKVSPRKLSNRIDNRQHEILITQAELMQKSICVPPISPLTGEKVRYGKES